MKTSIHCITLAVDDIARSAEFYRGGLGLPVAEGGDGADHIPIQLPNGLYLVLVDRAGFAEFARMTDQPEAPAGSSECILSYFASSKEEVDALLARVAGAGARTVPAAEKSWGYAGFFKDPDGHLWEVLWNAYLPVQEGG